MRDLAASVERMRAAGVVFRAPPEVAADERAAAGERAAYFDDLEGRPLALVADGAPRG